MTLRDFAISALLLLSLAAGCGRRERICKANETETAVDPALLAFLSRARAAHHIADSQEQLHPEQAQLTLSSVLTGPRPSKSSGLAPEVGEVLADTSARLADVESRLNEFEHATQTLNRALPWVPDVSYFRGHLYEVLGLVEERHARWLAGAGNSSAADEAKNRAIAAFEESMKIQAEVIRTSSADAGR